MPTSPEDNLPPRPWQRWLMLGVAALVVLHSFFVALWLSPDNPIREEIGTTRLSNYVNPYFQQTPLSMDPGAQYADESLQVRARIRVGETELQETEWVDLTAEALEKHGTGGRAARAARALATNLNGGLYLLPADLRSLVSEDYAEGDLADLEQQILDGGATAAESRRFFASQYMTLQFATLALGARFDGTIEQVQVRVGIRRVPDYDDRDEAELTDLEFEWTELGWRRPVRADEGAQRAFDKYMGG